MPKDEYKKFFQLFAAVIIAAVIFMPVLEVLSGNNFDYVEVNWDDVQSRIEKIEYREGDESDIFELFRNKESEGKIKDN